MVLIQEKILQERRSNGTLTYIHCNGIYRLLKVVLHFCWFFFLSFARNYEFYAFPVARHSEGTIALLSFEVIVPLWFLTADDIKLLLMQWMFVLKTLFYTQSKKWIPSLPHTSKLAQFDEHVSFSFSKSFTMLPLSYNLLNLCWIK